MRKQIKTEEDKKRKTNWPFTIHYSTKRSH